MSENETLEQQQEKRDKRRKLIKRIVIIAIIIIIILLLLRKCFYKKPETPIDDTIQQSEIIDDKDIKQEEVVIDKEVDDKNKILEDKTEVYYWVIFYDQYGNELQKDLLRYGFVPVFKGNYPEGFIEWDIPLVAITGNTYIHAICEDSSPSHEPEPVRDGIFTYINSETREVAQQIIPIGVTVTIDLDGGTIERELTIDVTELLRVDLRTNEFKPNGKDKFIGYEYIAETNTFKAHYGDYVVVFNTLKIGETPEVLYLEEGHGSSLISDPETSDTDEYYFEGWYKDYLFKNGLWDFDNDEVHSDVTLYAKWTIKDLYTKVLSVQKLLTVGENKLVRDITKSNTDIIRIGGVDCYVLQYNSSNNRAWFISKETYYSNFDNNSKYTYNNSTLKSWMDNFYNIYFKPYDTDPSIIPLPEFGYQFINSTINYYYLGSTPAGGHNPFKVNYMNKGTVTQKVSALDAATGNSYKAKFIKNNEKFYDNSAIAQGFWITGGYYNSSGSKGNRAMRLRNTGDTFVCGPASAHLYGDGARPCFWIQLEIPELEEEQTEQDEQVQPPIQEEQTEQNEQALPNVQEERPEQINIIEHTEQERIAEQMQDIIEKEETQEP